jgi:hypothetical protein
MQRYILIIIILVHGFIHFLGFSKAFNVGDIKQLTQYISKLAGVLWTIIALLFITTATLLLLRKNYWWVIAVTSILLSQIVIINNWKEAKYGTIANVIILVSAIAGWGRSSFESSWRRDIETSLAATTNTSELLTNVDIQHLPEPIKRYLQYVGVINKPKVKNMCVIFEGEMRERNKDYFSFKSFQYNFFTEPTRLFFMKGQMLGTTVEGYHSYIKGKAIMDIRLYGLFSIVYHKGAIMNKAETVTLLNDMCLMAPATLIDYRITWQLLDSNSVKAIFTNHDIAVSAILYFNQKGQLIDFISNDRTSVDDMKQYPWSTPMSDYKNYNGYNLASIGKAIWHYPDGKFTYGKFNLKKVLYNVDEIIK